MSEKKITEMQDRIRVLKKAQNFCVDMQKTLNEMMSDCGITMGVSQSADLFEVNKALSRQLDHTRLLLAQMRGE